MYMYIIITFSSPGNPCESIWNTLLYGTHIVTIIISHRRHRHHVGSGGGSDVTIIISLTAKSTSENNL